MIARALLLATALLASPATHALAQTRNDIIAAPVLRANVQVTGDLDHDFTALMIPHHQAAVDMANTYLESGADPELRRLAQHIVETQQQEIRQMRAYGGTPASASSAHAH